MRYLLLLCVFLTFLVKGQEIAFVEGVPRDTSFNLMRTFRKEVKYRPYIRIPADTLPQGVVAYESLIYSERAGRGLMLDLYRPSDEKVYPALLMVHGGGWSSGTRALQRPMAKAIAANGYVTVPVEYRLSPEALYPAAVYDLKEAVKWLRKNHVRYGIDPSRIAISGCSAGGQLASLIGMTNGNPIYESKEGLNGITANVQAVINIDGCVDFTEEEAARNASKAFSEGKMSASVKWLDGTIEKNRERWVEASPLFQVTDAAVPVCFINSSIARFHDGRDTMRSRLQQFDIPSEVHEFPDTPHPFWLFEPWFVPTVKIMTDFLDRTFGIDPV